ncbi:hypothetical protein RESH_03951 [Rhodopirellula europaea SH398]|uniref:Uncharacterized protein n=1 Tax=Rhodopirellula europaea SH398 TaxID=1263868 RepID=M5S1Y2_9BACT|nr:hypothetical protein RESH_03951 [Rhodopirellula europaea SH398]
MDIANWQLQVGETGDLPSRKHFAIRNEQFALCNPLTTIPMGEVAASRPGLVLRLPPRAKYVGSFGVICPRSLWMGPSE